MSLRKKFYKLNKLKIRFLNILVFVENVFQIATTNYTFVQNPAGKAPGFYISFSSAPDVGKPVTVLHNFDK